VFTSTRELVDNVVPVLRRALAAGRDVVLACGDQNNQVLADALAGAANLSRVPQDLVSRRAATALSFYRALVNRRLRDGSSGVCLVAEVDFGMGGWDEWRRFESSCNTALSGLPLWNLCVYDRRSLPEAVVATAELTHPFRRSGGALVPNATYVDPDELLRLPDSTLDLEAELEPTLQVADVHSLARLREQLRVELRAKRVRRPAADELVHLVHEVVSYGVRYGAGLVALRMWVVADRVVCTVTDRGGGLRDPFLLPEDDTAPPPREALGLWLARLGCDELVTMRNDEGFTVRLVKLR
jgi:anti-sigma regulatory factor (Ser/Thr protein kinase)